MPGHGAEYTSTEWGPGVTENPIQLYGLHRLPVQVEELLGRRFAIDWNESDRDLPLDTLVRLGTEYDGLVTTVTDRIPAPVFDAPGRRARIVANFGVGVNLIDLAAARRHGVVVTNTPDVLTDCTADLTMALMLMALRRLGEGERLVRAGQWDGWRPTHHLGRRATGLTLGIVGMGRIGQAVARRAYHGFGMRILYAGRSPAPAAIVTDLSATRQRLDQLFGLADVVSLHCPATPETEGLVDRRRLELMRPDAVLINTARGALVDERALAEAIRGGRLGGAGLDVYRDEPGVAAELLALDRVVLLPHLGSATIETRTAMGMVVVRNLEAFFSGEEPPNGV